jgi:hypothetical protein
MPGISRTLPTINRFFTIFAAFALLSPWQLKCFADPRLDPCVSLLAPVSTNGQIQLTLNCESRVTYILQSSADLQHWNSIVTNSDPSVARVFDLAAPDTASFYRVKRDPLPLFAYAIAARTNIDMNGNGLSTDSFNSVSPTLSNIGRYTNTMTSTNGDVAVLYGTLDLGNHTVVGDVFLGPTATLVGSASQVSGTIRTDFNYCYPSVVPPDTRSWFSLLATLPGTAPDGNSYDYVFTNSVDLIVPNLNGKVYVGTNAHVRLLAQAGKTSQVKVAGVGSTNGDHGTLTIYIAAPSFSIGGSGAIDGGRAACLSYFGLSSNRTINYSGNAIFVGTLHAPDADLLLNVGGSGTFDIFGSLIAKTVTFNGHFMFHFDEDLLTAGPKR